MLTKMDSPRYRSVAPLLLLAALLLLVALMGCTQQQSSPDLKTQTAQATAEVKHDAQEVVAGIREGWHHDKPLDLNTATKDQLLSLPGVTAAQAHRVIVGRPYNDPGDLGTRNTMPKPENNKISARGRT